MDFRFSKVVNPDTYSTDGLCDGIPLRVHKDLNCEVKGALRCQKDWSEGVSPIANYKGTLGPRFSFVSACIPEARPDRVEIASYANEYAFIYDGTQDIKVSGAVWKKKS
jgi:fusicocca-2,10(14)-diene synthase